MPFTTYTDNALLNALHGKTTYTAPSNVYYALSTTTPTSSGSNVTEPSGSGYARVAVPGSSWGSAASGSITNTTGFSFPAATGSWGTVTNLCAYDASSAGNLLWYASVTSQVVSSGVTVTINASALTDTIS